MQRRVLTLDGAGRIAVAEEPIPDLKPGRLLVEVRASCISPGTELGGVPARRREPNPSAPTRTFGYSSAGVVTTCGPDCREIRPGTRVACMGGGFALHTTHAVVPQNLAVPIPDGVSFEAAATNHLAATGLHAVRRGEFTLGEHVAVMGLGIVGHFAAQFAYRAGAYVVGVDRYPIRRNALAATGAVETTLAPDDPEFVARCRELSRGYGYDGGVIAFGGDGTPALKVLYQILKQAPDTHKMGRVVIVGGARIEHLFAAGLGNVDVRSSARPGPGYHDEAWEHGADYPPVFVPWTTRRNVEECLRFLADGRLTTEHLITHRVPLTEGPAVCDLLIEHPDQALGVILLP
ncbi:MAG: zinc-binding alcohol dehydrogenase [Armatimonadetes bacterium]|nr:zinc-binding alcohol dehydrogenase [Armatimonadota bacterium]